MKGNYISLTFLSILLFISSVWGACKSGESDSNLPHPPVTQRLYGYFGYTKENDLSVKGGNTLDILSFNVQSGLTQACVFNPDGQARVMRPAHFFGLQEVDINNDLRGNLDEAAYFSYYSGKDVLFLHTIYYRTGLYGGALGTAFPVIERRFYIFKNWAVEERGITAIRTQPPQLGGRTLWYLNTHYHWNGEQWQRLQAEETVAYIKGLVAEFPQALIILTGDMYIVPGHPGYSVLETYLQNAWSVGTGSPNGGFTYPANFPSSRFDHIWFRFPAGTQYQLEAVVENSQLSDHRPLWGHFTFPSTSVNTPPPNNPTTPAPVTPTPTPKPVGGCEVRVTIKKSGEWSTGAGVEGQYDIEVFNSGNRVATLVNFDIILASGSSITQKWNFEPSQSYKELSVLGVGATDNSAGFIVSFPSSPTFIAPTVSYKSTICQ